MENIAFEKVKHEFMTADTERKIEMYINLEGLTQLQYKELLRSFPFNEIDKLEAALT